MSFVQRTRFCGDLRAQDADQEVVLNGWAHRVRDLGGLLFVDMRDRTGLVQIFLDPPLFPTASTDIRSETCMSIRGEIRPRGEGTRNPNMPTGDVELVAKSYEV